MSNTPPPGGLSIGLERLLLTIAHLHDQASFTFIEQPRDTSRYGTALPVVVAADFTGDDFFLIAGDDLLLRDNGGSDLADLAAARTRPERPLPDRRDGPPAGKHADSASPGSVRGEVGVTCRIATGAAVSLSDRMTIAVKRLLAASFGNDPARAQRRSHGDLDRMDVSAHREASSKDTARNPDSSPRWKEM